MAVIVGPMLVAMLMLARYARAVQVRVGNGCLRARACARVSARARVYGCARACARGRHAGARGYGRVREHAYANVRASGCAGGRVDDRDRRCSFAFLPRLEISITSIL
jgi:ABC-type phosphonate transport system ATPase subunit